MPRSVIRSVLLALVASVLTGLGLQQSAGAAESFSYPAVGWPSAWSNPDAVRRQLRDDHQVGRVQQGLRELGPEQRRDLLPGLRYVGPHRARHEPRRRAERGRHRRRAWSCRTDSRGARPTSNVVVIEHTASSGEKFLAVYGHLRTDVVGLGPITKGAYVGKVADRRHRSPPALRHQARQLGRSHAQWLLGVLGGRRRQLHLQPSRHRRPAVLPRRAGAGHGQPRPARQPRRRAGPGARQHPGRRVDLRRRLPHAAAERPRLPGRAGGQRGRSRRRAGEVRAPRRRRGVPRGRRPPRLQRRDRRHRAGQPLGLRLRDQPAGRQQPADRPGRP